MFLDKRRLDIPVRSSSLKAKQFTFVHVPATTSMGRMNATETKEKKTHSRERRALKSKCSNAYVSYVVPRNDKMAWKKIDRKRRRHNIDFNNNNSRSSFSSSLFPFIFTRIHNFLFISFSPFFHSFCSVTLSSIHVVLSWVAFYFSLRAFLFLLFVKIVCRRIYRKFD